MTVIKIAHRGASGYKPQNTLAAFDKACELKVDYIECDTRLCHSGQLVVIHDKTVDKTTNGKGSVSKLTLQELKKLDAGQGESIPTLAEVLGRYQHRVKIMVDLKSPNCANAFLELIRRYQAQKNIIVASTYHHLLASIKIREPKIETAISFDIYNYLKHFFVKNFFVAAAKIIKAENVNIYYKFIDEDLVKRAHRHKIKINAFPPNNIEEIKWLKNIKVDGIISNFPDLI